MFSKHINKSLVKSGSATIVASLSLLLGVQISAYAVAAKSACAVGDDLAIACTIQTVPVLLPTFYEECLLAACSAVYEADNPAEVSCIWCGTH